MRRKNGFTLIELIVVLAIMATISAIAVPNFANIAEKSKLKADIQSARIIDNAKDLYESEINDGLGEEINDIMGNLYNKGYLKKKLLPQTSKAKFVLDSNLIKVDISGCGKSVKDNFVNLNEDEKFYVIGAGQENNDKE